MAFVSLEDETGPAEIIVFPKSWTEKEKMLEPGKAVIIEGKVSRGDGKRGRGRKAAPGAEEEAVAEDAPEMAKLLLENCQMVQETAMPTGPIRASKLTLDIPEHGDRDLLQRIKKTLESNPGKIPVTLMLPGVDGPQPMLISHKVDVGERLYSQLAYVLGPERVRAE
jgi:DNA polymerase III alpha subunit